MALSTLCCCCPNSEKKQGAHASKVAALPPESFGFVGKIGKSGFDSILRDDGIKPKDNSKRDTRDTEQRVVSELDNLARSMTKSIRKYPKSCKKFHRARDRFMSVIPVQEDKGLKPFQRWQRGVVAYWEDKSGFTSNSTPKGHMSLLRIAKVQHLEHQYDGCGVMIKHKPDDDFQEVIFILPTRHEAREFCYTLWEFIAKIRSHMHEFHT